MSQVSAAFEFTRATTPDTIGCILVGLNRQCDRITDSRKAYNSLMHRFDTLQKGQAALLIISQPENWPRWGKTVTVSAPAPERPLAKPLPSVESAVQWGYEDLHPVSPPLRADSIIASTPSELVTDVGEINSTPVSHPTDNPIPATVDSDRAWRTNLVTWMLSIGTGGWAYLQDNYRLLYLVAGIAAVVVVCWFVRSIILDRERMRLAADPGKYNVQ